MTRFFVLEDENIYIRKEKTQWDEILFQIHQAVIEKKNVDWFKFWISSENETKRLKLGEVDLGIA